MPPRRSITDSVIPPDDSTPEPKAVETPTWEAAIVDPSRFPNIRLALDFVDLLTENPDSGTLRSYIGSNIKDQITSLSKEDAIERIKQFGIKEVVFDPGEESDEEEEDPNEDFDIILTIRRTYSVTRVVDIQYRMTVTGPRGSDTDDIDYIVRSNYNERELGDMANRGDVHDMEDISEELVSTSVDGVRFT